jgi:hypothetical protein
VFPLNPKFVLHDVHVVSVPEQARQLVEHWVQLVTVPPGENCPIEHGEHVVPDSAKFASHEMQSLVEAVHCAQPVLVPEQG